jgi:hypothetical protein
MPKEIVAIGGGDIRTKGTAAIDREIIRLSGKKSPKLLFIPTASADFGTILEARARVFRRLSQV